MNIELVNLYKRVVEHFGSQTLTAQALDLEQPSVWAWVNGKAKMSSETALLVQEKTDGEFKYKDLFPSRKKNQQAA
ncbi:YdaS family helix-turn-helix protein [Acinetobacter guillouiae]|uniref:YdaS family helix-turn-helix protein n=1 Tax=Acinetobacter guillouiae TaxID=106649 RepID=UPI0028EAB70D|nr:YdaS family helix-turn-helix protein [Acinetobacter guillouiae]